MEVLSSRILVRPGDLGRSRRFYRDVLGLAIYRMFGPLEDPGLVFFLGQGFLEVSGHADGPAGGPVMIWIQVRDVRAEPARLAAAGATVIRESVTEPWGLTEMHLRTDGTWIILVEVSGGHPLRRDRRPASPRGDEPARHRRPFIPAGYCQASHIRVRRNQIRRDPWLRAWFAAARSAGQLRVPAPQ